jgi:PAS domain S-box-containing protein
MNLSPGQYVIYNAVIKIFLKPIIIIAMMDDQYGLLKAKERHLELIYNTTTDSIFLISVEAGRFKITSVNQTFLNDSRTKKEEVVGKYIDEITPEPLLSTVLKKYREAILTRQTVRWEDVFNYPITGKTYGSISVTPVFNNRGNCTMLVVTLNNITDRKKAERDLIEAEERFRSIVEQSIIGVYIIVEGNFVYVNPQLEKIFGYLAGELDSSPVKNVIYPGDWEMVKEHIRARLEGEQTVVHYEARGIKKNGELLWIEIFCSGQAEEKSRAIMGTLLDITERKSAEENLKKSEANLKTIFDTTEDGYALLDNNFEIISYNQPGLEFVQRELHCKPGAGNNLIDFIPETRRRVLLEMRKKVMKGEHVNYEVSYLQPDGSTRWYYIRMLPVTNTEKNVFGMMMVVTDLTEKKRMEQEILDQRVQAQKMITREILKAEEKERNKIGQELHDNVNQILVSIKLFLNMAREKAAAVNEGLLSRSTELVDNAIEEIRTLTASQVTPLKSINLQELIQSLIHKIDETTAIKTSFQYNINGHVIDDDVKLNIYRIVQEQMNNILKHAAASHINIQVSQDQLFLHITIIDDGKGFDPQKKRAGIGISNMINRAGSFNGELKIESSPGQGCKLTVRIPVNSSL